MRSILRGVVVIGLVACLALPVLAQASVFVNSGFNGNLAYWTAEGSWAYTPTEGHTVVGAAGSDYDPDSLSQALSIGGSADSLVVGAWGKGAAWSVECCRSSDSLCSGSGTLGGSVGWEYNSYDASGLLSDDNDIVTCEFNNAERGTMTYLDDMYASIGYPLVVMPSVPLTNEWNSMWNSWWSNPFLQAFIYSIVGISLGGFILATFRRMSNSMAGSGAGIRGGVLRLGKAKGLYEAGYGQGYDVAQHDIETMGGPDPRNIDDATDWDDGYTDGYGDAVQGKDPKHPLAPAGDYPG